MAPRTPRIDPHDARQRLLEVARVYGDGTLGAPSRFFPVPELPQVTATRQGDGPLGTRVFDLAYPSGYEPFLAEARDDISFRAAENRTAHARWWTSGDGRPTIVLLHGWGGGNHWVTERTFAVSAEPDANVRSLTGEKNRKIARNTAGAGERTVTNERRPPARA